MHTGPGGGGDVLARFIAQAVEKEKLAPVRMTVNNKTGGGGLTAMNYVVEKKGDAHAIAVFTGIWIDEPAHAGRSQGDHEGHDARSCVSCWSRRWSWSRRTRRTRR